MPPPPPSAPHFGEYLRGASPGFATTYIHIHAIRLLLEPFRTRGPTRSGSFLLCSTLHTTIDTAGGRTPFHTRSGRGYRCLHAIRLQVRRQIPGNADHGHGGVYLKQGSRRRWARSPGSLGIRGLEHWGIFPLCTPCTLIEWAVECFNNTWSRSRRRVDVSSEALCSTRHTPTSARLCMTNEPCRVNTRICLPPPALTPPYFIFPPAGS